jgi:preprotein translocase subunit SecA
MKRYLAIFSIVLAFFIFTGCQNVKTEDPAKAAKASLANFIKAAKEKNVDEAKKYLSKDALQELEKEGMLDMVLQVWGELNPDAFKAEVKPDRVILKMEEVEKTKEGTSTTAVTIHMVKEDGQWKIGKPE